MDQTCILLLFVGAIALLVWWWQSTNNLDKFKHHKKIVIDSSCTPCLDGGAICSCRHENGDYCGESDCDGMCPEHCHTR